MWLGHVVQEGLSGLGERIQRGLPVAPALHLRMAVAIQVLVDAEEVRDLRPQLSGHVVHVGQVVPSRVAAGDDDEMWVVPFFIGHLEQPDDLRRDDATREGWLRDADEHVHRIAVGSQRFRNKPVVRGVHDRR